MKPRKHLNILCCLLTAIMLASAFSFSSFAQTKTQTRTKVGPGCAVDATMRFDLTNGKVSNGTCTSVKKNSSFWFCTYVNHSKTPYRYSNNTYYRVHTSGLWADPGDKGSIVNIDVTGFR